jgi:predicted ATP-dependent endonuclease of OLD family
MLSVLHFEEVRRVTRNREATPAPMTHVHEVSSEVLVDLWHDICGREDIRLESIRDRLNNVYDPYRNEGFLSSKILLCEGETERYALPIYFRAIGFDLDENGIALIDTGGVELLEYFYLLFTELGVPTYVIWDSDTPRELDEIDNIQDKNKIKSIYNNSRRNEHLADLLGVLTPSRDDGTVFWATETVSERGAVFPHTYEETMMTILPNSEKVKGEAKNLYGTDSKSLCARFYANTAVKRGRKEGNPRKYVPGIVMQVAERLAALTEPEKQSAVRGIRQ